jgi:hypothetical protein
MIRDDITDKLVHLTRGKPEEAACSFVAIFNDGADGVLRDGKGLKEDGYSRICFSEAPLSKLGHILAAKDGGGIRYRPFGVTVDKRWLFERGGRPVIYQPATDRDLLPDSMKFRHVTYDPRDSSEADYSWEREWRIPCPELKLDADAMTLVVPTRAWETWAREKRLAQIMRAAKVTRGHSPRSMTEFRWYFMVLEDLGIVFPDVPAPPAM